MNIKNALKSLLEIYARFEEMAEPFSRSAVCGPGCADCCTSVGDIDSTTLEGFNILGHLQGLDAARQKTFQKALKENARLKATSKFVRCPFLLKDDRCGIYSVRPFSCRRVYSVSTCGLQGPTVSRQLWDLAEGTVTAIQELDDTGYSGHLTFIIQLVKEARFRKTYLSGGFSPDEISVFAQQHRLAINRFANPR
ncbi:MAG: YkgJ family cysteine cluster protein [Acidobacteriota bacterium]